MAKLSGLRILYTFDLDLLHDIHVENVPPDLGDQNQPDAVCGGYRPRCIGQFECCPHPPGRDEAERTRQDF